MVWRQSFLPAADPVRAQAAVRVSERTESRGIELPQSQDSERGDDTVGNPHRAQSSQFELFELILLFTLAKQFPVEQFEAAVSQSTVPSPPLEDGRASRRRGGSTATGFRPWRSGTRRGPLV